MSTTSKSARALRSTLRAHCAIDSIKVDDTNETVVELRSSMTPMEATSVLWKNKILGAPVWNESLGEYIGSFDTRYILGAVTAAVRDCHKSDDDMDATEQFKSNLEQQLRLLYSNNNNDESPLTLKHLKSLQPIRTCAPKATLEVLCGLFVKDERCHGVPLQENGGRITQILSKAALLKYLSDHTDHSLLEETLNEAGIAYEKEVVTIVDSAPAYQAFETLVTNNISGVAVVDEESGRLLGNTSARDIQLAVTTDSGCKISMDQDILSYLAAVRQATPVKKDRYPSCHVHCDSTIGNVISILSKTGYHRIFVVNDNTCPTGVISVADIIRFVMTATTAST